MQVVVVDSDILLRHILRDDPEQSPRATQALWQEMEEGKTLLITTIVLAETLWVVTRGHNIPWRNAAATLLELLQNPQTVTENKAQALRALEWMMAYHVPFTDAYLAAVAQSPNTEVLTFDVQDFKKMPCRWHRPK